MVPRNRMVDPKAPSRAFFVSIGSPEMGLVPIFLPGGRWRPVKNRCDDPRASGGGPRLRTARDRIHSAGRNSVVRVYTTARMVLVSASTIAERVSRAIARCSRPRIRSGTSTSSRSHRPDLTAAADRGAFRALRGKRGAHRACGADRRATPVSRASRCRRGRQGDD